MAKCAICGKAVTTGMVVHAGCLATLPPAQPNAMRLTEQDIINLTNSAKRKAVLDAWRDWPVWVSVPEIGLTVHKLGLPGGQAFTASWYEGDTYVLQGRKREPGPCLHLIGYDGKLAHGSQGETVLIEELQALRKKLLAKRVK